MNRSFSLPFLIMGVVFCVCLICSNLLEVKMISLGGITATAGLIVVSQRFGGIEKPDSLFGSDS